MRDYHKAEKEAENRFYEGRENYRQIPVPAEMKEKLEKAIERAEEENGMEKKESGMQEKTGGMEKKENGMRKKKGKRIGFRIGLAAAAAAALLIILPNTGAEAAYAMGNLPVLGRLFQVVTFRDYQYESERFDADVEVPQIVVEDVDKKEDTGEKEAAEKDEESGTALQETVDKINFDVEEVTNQLIQEFQETADMGEGHGSLEIHHETAMNNERYFTLKLSIFQAAGSGAQSYKFYTIDKKSGEQVQIGDLFRADSDYREIISENIKYQMRTKMAEDENMMYWVDDKEMPELNWQGLKEDQNFYFDGEGNLVVAFDEYEVAPGYMGAQEFTVEKQVFEDFLKE